MVAGTPLVSVSTAAAEAGMPAATRDAVIQCESGGDPKAQNDHSTASGAYQFINATWKTYGGSTTRARDASLAEQHRVADRAYVKNGLRDWEASRSCWQPKMGRHASGREAPHAVATHHGRHHHRTVGQVHIVQRGDTLSGIAAAHALSLSTIIAANREIIDDPDRIVPGQRIRI
jgi:nucleoid-associated protein YgaU